MFRFLSTFFSFNFVDTAKSGPFKNCSVERADSHLGTAAPSTSKGCSRVDDEEARSRFIEKKPPKAVISLGADVDAPLGENMETSG